MGDVVERERRYRFPRPSLSAIIVCVLAFGTSASLPTRTLSHSMGTALGVAMVLFAIAPAVREISDDLQTWTLTGGFMVIGAAVGFLIRLLIFR